MDMNITVAGPDKRAEVQATEETTIADLLKQQDITYAKASVMIDGTTLPEDSLTKSLKEIGAVSGSTIAVCIKMQNA